MLWHPARGCDIAHDPTDTANNASSQAIMFLARSSSVFSPISHCHTVSTFQPPCCRVFPARRSRSTLAAIFSAQNSVRVAGKAARRQPSWQCQKQPCTKTATLREAKTKSGEPGSRLSCNRKRRPFACRNLRTSISGFVSLPRMRDISSLRRFAVSRSKTLPGRLH
jgi:hypothetical protein